jgi:tripartite-type tricarboxylate transporter receptor subunit TctC
MSKRLITSLAMAGALAVSLVGGAAAQDFPNKPITLIAWVPAGPTISIPGSSPA